MTWTCTKCSRKNADFATSCFGCGDVRVVDIAPAAGLSEEERAALDAAVAASVALGETPMTEDEFLAEEELRKMTVAFVIAARYPLEAEIKDLKLRTSGDVDLAAAVLKLQEARATLEAENARLRERVSDVEGERNGWRESSVRMAAAFREQEKRANAMEAQLAQAQKPDAPDGLPEVGEPVYVIQAGGKFCRDVVTKVESWGGEAAFRAKENYGLFLASKEGEEWRRIQPAQTSREPSPHVADAVPYSCKPAASPPGEVSVDNLRRWYDDSTVEGNWVDIKREAEADIRANVERATKELRHDLDYHMHMAKKDKARIAELEAKLREERILAEKDRGEVAMQRDAALAEVERLKGELETLRAFAVNVWRETHHTRFADSVLPLIRDDVSAMYCDEVKGIHEP